MKRILLIVGCFLLPVGVLYLALAGSAWAGILGESGGVCEGCEPTVHIEMGGTAVVEGGGPAIYLSKTVDLNPSTCAAGLSVTLPPGGGTVYYCYFVGNVGDVTLTQHTVVDDKLGILLGPAFPVALLPGATAWFTVEAVITETTINFATWEAYNPGPTDVVSDTDGALVRVESPITYLTATNDSPTAIGQATDFGTSLGGGGNETYAWAFGDGDFGAGAATTHIYPAIGVYTAVVTATNSLNSMTATTVVTITHPPVYMPGVFRP